MADWYVSSTAYAAIPQWAPNTAYSVGQFVRPVTPSQLYMYMPHRCTTAGTSGATEPSWNWGNNQTTPSGSATFTCVAGQSAYGWSAAFGTLLSNTLAGFIRSVAGDTTYVSSDHVETASGLSYSFASQSQGAVRLISVNRAGSVPPTVADQQSGAVFNTTGNFILDASVSTYYQGITFNVSGQLYLNSGQYKSHYFKNCAFSFGASNTSKIVSNNPSKATFDNTTFQFANVNQGFQSVSYTFDITWLNTLNAVSGSPLPSTLFVQGASVLTLANLRGVDLSAFSGNLTASAGCSARILLENCRINPALTRLAGIATNQTAQDEVELVNCFDGVNTITERYNDFGSVFTDRNVFLTGGAADSIGPYSFKMQSNGFAGSPHASLNCFWFDVDNSAIGVSKTATVEIGSPSTLNNIDVRMALSYMGTSGSTITSFIDTLATELTPSAALPSSSNNWTASTSYAAWNPTDLVSVTLSNNNLTATPTGTGGVRTIANYNAGKVYWEFTYVSGSAFPIAAGMGLGSVNLFTCGSGTTTGFVGVTKANGTITVNNTNPGPALGTRSDGDVIGVAIDLTAKLAWFRVAPSGNWNGSGTANPATGIGGVDITVISTGPLYAMTATNGAGVITANFGASAFIGAVPSGFTAGLQLMPAVKQLLQVTFTPRVAGRVRARARLVKTNTVLWVNPQIAIT